MYSPITVLGALGKRLVVLMRYAFIAALVLALSGAPAAAQGSVSTYLPLVGRNQPGVVNDPQWVSPFGIVMYGSVSDSAGLQRMQEAGARWVVTGFHWAKVEPTEGARNWATYDAQFLAAKQAGMDVAVLVMNVPVWARNGCNSGGCPDMNAEALADFLAAAAERYDGDGKDDAPGNPVVKYWTLFAEPDYCGVLVGETCTVRPGYGEEFKGLWGFNGAQYASMLAAARTAIKGAAPNALVMNGGAAFDWFVQPWYGLPTGPYDRTFLADVIKNGGVLDMLAVHYYPITMGDWGQKLDELYLTGAERGVEQQMRALPVISPEMGYWSSGKYSDEPQQARRLVQMFVRGLASGIQRLAWFAVFDGSPEHPTEAHGLFRASSLGLSYANAKPAYWAYRTMTTALHGFRYHSAYYSEPGALLSQWDHEAYEFRRAADGARMLVAWANSGEQVNPDGTSDMVIPGGHVTLASHLSLNAANPNVLALVEVQDGGPGDADGQANGLVKLWIGTDPVYIFLP